MSINRANWHQVRLTQAASSGAIDSRQLKGSARDIKPQHVKRAITTRKVAVTKPQEGQRGTTTQETTDTVALRSKLIKEMKVREREGKYQQASIQAFQARELKTIKGVLRMWLSSVLNPTGQFQIFGNQKLQSNQLQQLLENWLLLSRSSIESVEKFLEVQFAHLPDNYQIFVKLQLVRLIKDAKRILEDFESNLELSGEADDGTVLQHAATTGSAFGIAFVKLKRKGKSYLDIRSELKVHEREEVNSSSEVNEDKQSFYENIRNARELLQQAERELKEAIRNGADKDKIEAIIEKLAEAYTIMMELYRPKGKVHYSYG